MGNKIKNFFKSKLFIWTSISLVVCLFVFVHFIGPRMIIGRRANDKPYPKLVDFELKATNFTTISDDGLKLASVFCSSNIDTIYGTVIFIHGIGSRKERFYPMVEFLANQGFQSIVVDLRAHGESEGDYVTFGYHETKDISKIINEMEKSHYLGSLGIWGQSLGGAISLQMLAKDDRISFGIIESTYSNFDEVIHEYANRLIGIPLGILNDYAIWRAQSIASFDKKDLNPEEVCKKITQPILYVHGTADDRIDVSCAHRNFNVILSKDKELLLIEGASHVNVWDLGGEDYKTKCLNFLKDKSSKSR